MLAFADYHEQASRTFDPELRGTKAMLASTLGIAAEGGKILDHIKKHLYHGHQIDQAELCKMLGDMLWYSDWLASTLGKDMSYVARQNLSRLALRYPDQFPHEQPDPPR